MEQKLTIQQLFDLGLNTDTAKQLLHELEIIFISSKSASDAWQIISKNILNASYNMALREKTGSSFKLHLLLFETLFPNWRKEPASAPAFTPSESIKKTSNIAKMMTAKNFASVAALHAWSVSQFEDFWKTMLETLSIKFQKPPKVICDLANGIEHLRWFPGGKMNIIDSCFNADPASIALIYADKVMTYGELNQLSNQIANSLLALGLSQNDATAIIMPMNHLAIAFYLGVIKTGGIVVSIADSFASQEIALRLKIAHTKLVITQDFIIRDNKKIALYERVKEASLLATVVIPCESENSCSLRDGDLELKTFLQANSIFNSLPCEPMANCNILFSSGTTAAPKAIPWNHTTPIKAASDAFFHHNIQKNDVLCWPTNLGWMMGPWLIFAAFINQASIALYTETPNKRDFGKFIEQAKVTMLGVVPSLVSAWRESACMENLDWHAIKTFSSTGECSNAEDMLYLMSLANYKPIIEYCGGTEIGGGYVSSTVFENNYPSLFSTKAMGSDFIIIDENGAETNCGEIAIIPPALGLSTELLNADHHSVYYADMPTSKLEKPLRRHGDQIKRLVNGYYMLLGRIDDNMNLGGIKISASEIERVLGGLPHISEVAAIAVAPQNGGPSQLIIFAATDDISVIDKSQMLYLVQKRISTQLNPLFKCHDLVFVKDLPKTASNKIIRRELRKTYTATHFDKFQ